MVPLQPGDPGSTTAAEAYVGRLIERYVDQLKAAGAIRSPAVERAFWTVPRPSTHRTLPWSTTTPTIPALNTSG